MGGILLLISGLALAFMDLDLGIDLSFATDIFGWGLIITGLIYLIFGYGLWSGWKILWYLGVILYLLSLIVGVYALVVGGAVSIISIIITLVILWYLFRPNVKEFFRIGA
ncbi:MAG: hypothetical protein LBU30_05240 [Candidatus Methanoplasma sp.]|nr:hypothetical protein [Candidatus Methanoplasma sp.]